MNHSAYPDSLLSALLRGEHPDRDGWRALLLVDDKAWWQQVCHEALQLTLRQFGSGVYVRGLVEISSYCRNNCYYCGIRHANRHASRYRLSTAQVLDCCREGDALGFHTFVLQGGEDEVQDDGWIADTVAAIRAAYPHHAITLSVGERPYEAYARFRQAGANRYLLRHETRNDAHYARLHPRTMSAAARRDCLFQLRELGYQVGAGMMIGSPYQTLDHLLDDIAFLEELQPHMIGMGPFVPAAYTPFAQMHCGSVELTVRMVALMRLRFVRVLLPATTALATLSPEGRELALMAGANVVMPNLSPVYARGKYTLYDGKAAAGAEAAQGLAQLAQRLQRIGRHIDFGRGDWQAAPTPD